MRYRKTFHNDAITGVPDPKLDTFTDVKRALNKWLYANDEIYQKAVTLATERNRRRKERTNETTD